jgi:hypothetical protein
LPFHSRYGLGSIRRKTFFNDARGDLGACGVDAHIGTGELDQMNVFGFAVARDIEQIDPTRRTATLAPTLT